MSSTEEYRVRHRVMDGKKEREDIRTYLKASEESFHDQLDAAEKVGLYPLISPREQGFSFQLRTFTEGKQLITKAMRGRFRTCVDWLGATLLQFSNFRHGKPRASKDQPATCLSLTRGPRRDGGKLCAWLEK